MAEIKSDAIGMAASERRIPAARVAWLRGASRAASATVLLLGALTLTIWLIGDHTIAEAVSPLPTRASTAVALALLGISIWALAGDGPSSRRLSIGAASLVAVGAATRLGGYAWDITPLLERALAREGADALFVERLSPATLTAVVLLSLGILALHRAGRLRRIGEGLVLVGGGIGVLGCLGYLLGTEHLQSIAGFASVSLPTAVALVLASVAALLAQPTNGLSRVLVAESAGGDSARRLLPLALAAPFATMLLARLGTVMGLYDFDVQVAMASLMSTAFLGAVVWSGASSLERSERLRRIAEGAAEVDALTGLGTRRHLDFELAALHASSVAASYSVISLDVDGLKQLNDSMGHTAGDDALRGLAHAIRGAVRPGDVVARLGGDEFVVVLPGASEEAAALVLARLRRRILDARADEPTRRLAASLGLATLQRGEMPSAVLARADAAMYRQKATRSVRTVAG